ncbi:MAG: S8 family serine peptidase [Chlorobi bacterium]|nr:S8 family serine peptidase [Chlorobiota bacterium]
MFYKRIIFLFFSVLFCLSSNAQNRYWVIFNNKKDVKFNPLEYFDAKTIERRIKYGIPLYDSTDYPLNVNYVQQVSQIAETTGKQSRWFNSVAVTATLEQLKNIEKLKFVDGVIPVFIEMHPAQTDYSTELSKKNINLLLNQIERMQGNLFIQNNIDGKSIRIAIFDGGFPSVNNNPVFEKIRNENRLVKTWDFVKNKEFVFDYNLHGTSVMSCIGGKTDSLNIGLATGAEYFLARTEVATEPFSEEENWLAAAEWADKNGIDIINSSLGYTFNRYFVEQMDGKTSLVVKAANMAASKGMLVVNAMGNDGTNRWKYVDTPADADSVLSVGGIDPYTNFHAEFSSYGPTADKRLKPNVVAYSTVVAAGKSSLKKTYGTSFSSPLVAGFAACAWQLHPELSNMDIYKAICKSADLYPYYDYAHGYGVPQASYFLNLSDSVRAETFEFEKKDNEINISVFDNFLNDSSKYEDYLYYHIEDTKGNLRKYAVIKVNESNALSIPDSVLVKNDRIKVHYKGYTNSLLVN